MRDQPRRPKLLGSPLCLGHIRRTIALKTTSQSHRSARGLGAWLKRPLPKAHLVAWAEARVALGFVGNSGEEPHTFCLSRYQGFP